jgi:SPRY domain/Concanavalin A-like lectin/glucanases superfamily
MFKKSAAPSSGYNLTKSLRFRSSASAYMNRTPGSASNRTTWTFSTWIKRGVISGSLTLGIFSAGTNNSDDTVLRWDGDNLDFFNRNSGTINARLTSNAVYRDPSAWYHLVLVWDTTQATSSNRAKLYINGSQITSLSTATYPSQNQTSNINTSGVIHYINNATTLSFYNDGEMAETIFVDGQALTPSSFGSTNATTGVWQPAKYTGTYGTNGWYLPYTNTTSTTTLGYDLSGNSNNWTTNNLSLTADSTYDSMTDVPTLTSTTVANYCVLNAVNKGANINLTNGNLQYDNVTSDASVFGTFGMSSGKWYWEMTVTSSGNSCGIAAGALPSSSAPGGSATGYAYNYDGRKVNNGSLSSYGSSYTTGDVIGFAFDADAGTITCYKNNTSQGTMFSGLTSGPYFAAAGNGGSGAAYNFGQQGFKYTPPTGFVALNTYNLPTSTIVNGGSYMDATTYTGTGSAASITNTYSFKPDFVWLKCRSNSTNHYLTDSVRGTNQQIYSNSTAAEGTSGNIITALNSNGFSLGTDAEINGSTRTYVGWQWQAGQGSSSSNTDGSITSTVSKNATAGFSIVTATMALSGAQTVGHGLGIAPSLIISKDRTQANNWYTYHSALGNSAYIILNSTNAAVTGSSYWNNTSPTSSVFSLGSVFAGVADSLVFYCWAAIPGFSAFGSYTGTGGSSGSSGPFVYCGFRPRWIMIKRTDSTGNWYVLDTSINPYNEAKETLYPNLSNAEGTNANFMNILSNGFFITEPGVSVSSATYIYAAFAENPFKNSLAR